MIFNWLRRQEANAISCIIESYIASLNLKVELERRRAYREIAIENSRERAKQGVVTLRWSYALGRWCGIEDWYDHGVRRATPRP